MKFDRSNKFHLCYYDYYVMNNLRNEQVNTFNLLTMVLALLEEIELLSVLINLFPKFTHMNLYILTDRLAIEKYNLPVEIRYMYSILGISMTK